MNKRLMIVILAAAIVAVSSIEASAQIYGYVTIDPYNNPAYRSLYETKMRVYRVTPNGEVKVAETTCNSQTEWNQGCPDESGLYMFSRDDNGVDLTPARYAIYTEGKYLRGRRVVVDYQGFWTQRNISLRYVDMGLYAWNQPTQFTLGVAHSTPVYVYNYSGVDRWFRVRTILVTRSQTSLDARNEAVSKYILVNNYSTHGFNLSVILPPAANKLPRGSEVCLELQLEDINGPIVGQYAKERYCGPFTGNGPTPPTPQSN